MDLITPPDFHNSHDTPDFHNSHDTPSPFSAGMIILFISPQALKNILSTSLQARKRSESLDSKQTKRSGGQKEGAVFVKSRYLS